MVVENVIPLWCFLSKSESLKSSSTRDTSVPQVDIEVKCIGAGVAEKDQVSMTNGREDDETLSP